MPTGTVQDRATQDLLWAPNRPAGDASQSGALPDVSAADARDPGRGNLSRQRRRHYWVDWRSQLPTLLLGVGTMVVIVVLFNLTFLDLTKSRRESIIQTVPEMGALLEAQDRTFHRLLSTASALLIVCMSVGLVVLTQRSAGPIHRLESHLRQVAEGNLAHSVTLRRRDHFRSLAEECNRTIRALQERTRRDIATLECLAVAVESLVPGAPGRDVVESLRHLSAEKRSMLSPAESAPSPASCADA